MKFIFKAMIVLLLLALGAVVAYHLSQEGKKAAEKLPEAMSAQSIPDPMKPDSDAPPNAWTASPRVTEQRPQSAGATSQRSIREQVDRIARFNRVEVTAYDDRKPPFIYLDVRWVGNQATTGADFMEDLRRNGLIRDWDMIGRPRPPASDQAGRLIFFAQFKATR